MKHIFLACLVGLIVHCLFAAATDPTDAKGQLLPDNERVTFLQYRRDRTAIVRIDRSHQSSMIARVPLAQSQFSETEIAGEVRWGRPRTGWQAKIVDKPDGMECALEHQRTGVLVGCWKEDEDEDTGEDE